MQKFIVTYTLSCWYTDNVVAHFVDETFYLESGTHVYEHLNNLYPMYNVFIENLDDCPTCAF